MDYQVFPPARSLSYTGGDCALAALGGATACGAGAEVLFRILPPILRPRHVDGGGYRYQVGGAFRPAPVEERQGYRLTISPSGIAIEAADLPGLRYGLDTLAQILDQAEDGRVRCLCIEDAPALCSRGLMLDVSRGKVYTREYLLGLADLLGRLRFNVLQLYVEHTFDFRGHPEICQGSGPLTAEDIRALLARCRENGIELQANLQSLGHCRRILTRPAHRHLAESDMYWSLDTVQEASLDLLEELYGEYLPLFDSPWLNVCMDEPYDIGKGQNAGSGLPGQALYMAYLLKVRALAARFGKRLMVFGDVFSRHPELLDSLPEDVLLLDWCYDPKPTYGTPQLFGQKGVPFWVCPGTGNWNTLFPRLDGAKRNVLRFTQEGLRAGAEGMLLTDWNDHGGYTQPGPGYYLYTYAADLAWSGAEQSGACVDAHADRVLGLPGYSGVINTLSEIYSLPPIWSKNRSECVMALFDEPVFGRTVRGPEPPEGLTACELELPAGVEHVLERHSQHPLRPCFQIPRATCTEIVRLASDAAERARMLPAGAVRDQLLYTADAFLLAMDKLDLSRRVIACIEGGSADALALLDLEDALRVMTARLCRLQLNFAHCWHAVAKTSEIELAWTYFAHIISRMDYLRNWLTLQRERLAAGQDVDTAFRTYQTADYETLPTY